MKTLKIIILMMLITNLSFSQEFEDSPFGIFGVFSANAYRQFNIAMGFSKEDYYAWAGSHFQNLGAKWSRENTLLVWELVEPELGGGYDWQTRDSEEIIEAAYQYGGDNFNLILAIDPKRNRNVRWLEEGNETLEESFKNFVKAAVNKYGDKVKYWQVFNEPFPNTWIKLGGTTDGYVAFLRLMHDAVKETDPEAKILLGSQIVSECPVRTLDNLKGVISKLNGEPIFDIIDLHHWEGAEAYKTPKLDELKEFLDSEGYNDVQIWSLEHGTHVNDPNDSPECVITYQSEKDQSVSLIKRYAYNFAHGISLINWNNLVEWSCYGGHCGGIFDNMGLISDGQNSGETLATLGVPRLSYYTYKLLVEKLKGSDWDNIGTTSDGQDNLYTYKFTKTETGEPVYVAWWDWFDELTYVEGDSMMVELTVEDIDSVKITQVVPDAESGADLNENDYPTFFATETKQVVEGTVTITLSINPVFIEVLSSTISIKEETDSFVSSEFSLEQNYPNPFNPGTTIEYQLPVSSHITLSIFNVLGQEVRTLVDENKSAGSHSAVWNGKDSFGKEAVGGIYFLQLRVKDFIQTKKLLLLK